MTRPDEGATAPQPDEDAVPAPAAETGQPDPPDEEPELHGFTANHSEVRLRR